MHLNTGKGGGPHPFSNAFKGDNVNSLRYNSADRGSPVAVCYGTQRLNVNIIAGFGLTGSASGGKKGGGSSGKGGSKQTKKGDGTYSVNVAMAICQGPVSFEGAPFGIGGQNRVWADAGVAAANAVGLNIYTGELGQDPDPVFESTSDDPPILGYSGTCYVTGTPMNLGSTPALPNMQAETTAFGANTCGDDCPGDARPDFILLDILTNQTFGTDFPVDNLDCEGGWGNGGTINDWGIYCQAQKLGMSILMDRQQPVARWIEDLLTLTASTAVWSGTKLKVIPFGDASVTNNGVTWNPVLTWQYDLDDDDFLPWQPSDFGGASDHPTDPVIVTAKDTNTIPNWVNIECTPAQYEYNREVIPVFDQDAIDREGLRVSGSISADGFTNTTAATISAQLQLQRLRFVLNTYKFKLSWKFSLLEPMDIVLITDPICGLNRAAARIIQVEEDDAGDLTITAEEIQSVVP